MSVYVYVDITKPFTCLRFGPADKMAPAIGFIRASVLYGLAEFATSQNLYAQDLIKEVGLPDDVLEHPESFIPYRKFAVMLALSTQRSGNPLFAFH